MDGLDPLPLGESFSSVRGVFLTFARVLESHLCHKTGVLYWALVSMFRVCIRLRVIHSSGKAPRLTPAHFIAEQYPSSERKTTSFTVAKDNDNDDNGDDHH